MKIPVFPLNGAVLFPKTNLPLNIFEERYIDMVDYSLSNQRLIGMIQQKQNGELYNIGCYGKIISFNETIDKRYIINLEGIGCYRVINEVKTDYKFRMCEISLYSNFKDTNLEPDLKPQILEKYKKYNKIKEIDVILEEIAKLELDELLKFIVMVSPFEISIKQMLLELKTNKELYEKVLSTIEIELASSQDLKTIN